MIVVAKDDVLRGLKRFKRLAKQDLLASSKTSNPEFWEKQAEARREKYTQLMDIIERIGVDAACDRALKDYAALPLVHSQETPDPVTSGYQQALEMFFKIVGVDEKARLQMQGERRNLPEDAALNATS